MLPILALLVPLLTGCLAGSAVAIGGSEAPAIPDLEQTIEAWLHVRRWVDALDAPDATAAEASCPIDGATAACVTLRLRGRVVATGVDTTGDALVVRRAAGRALAGMLGDAEAARVPSELRGDLSQRMTVELEVAGRSMPLPGRTFEHLAAQVEPGLNGVAIVRGQERAMWFPSQLRSLDLAGAGDAPLRSLATQLSLPAVSWGQLRRDYAVRAYRFRTIHLAQRAPGRAPFETFRGQIVVPIEAVNRGAMIEAGRGIANHLLMSLWPGEEPFGLMGDYSAAGDEHEPLIASPRDQALAALGLARLADVADLPASDRERFRAGAAAILVELAAVGPGETGALDDLVTCAAIVYAFDSCREAAAEEPGASLERAALERVLGAAVDEAPPGAGAAMVAGALARRGASARTKPDAGAPSAPSPERVPSPEAIRCAIDAAWDSVSGPERAALLPFIGWAEIDCAAVAGGPIARGSDLRALGDVLEAARETVPALPDQVGGFRLAGTVDSQSTRPASWLATALRESEIVSAADRAPAEGRHRLTMRYLLQLTVRDEDLWAYRRPERALGGVRASTWDLDQPVAAQAMALLAVAETLASLDD